MENLNRSDLFSIDEAVRQKFPSITIGVAIIRNVNIQKSHTELRSRVQEFVRSQDGLSNEIIGSYPEIQSYRRLYKEMGIDWHSRRPSPEALLRRVSQGKSLYTINSCVDAYNLVVMRNRVSCGAFDLDKIVFPTVLRFPKEGESIILLGDNEPTVYKPTELAYFDHSGGYNIDFNYRDAQRTGVFETTKNLLINVDGLYNITREQVQKSLQETIDEIIQYCGGTVGIADIVQA